MKELWICIKNDDDGTNQSVESMNREEAARRLLQPARISGKAFGITDDDSGDVLMIKRAIAQAGGVHQLAYFLSVTRAVIYQWVRRGNVPSWHRAAVLDMARNYLAEK